MFQTKNEFPLWQIVYDGIKDMPVGTLLTFSDLKEINDDIVSSRSPIYKANMKLIENYQKFLKSEKGVGYRIANGVEHVEHAQSRTKRARRQVKLANFEIVNVNTNEMSQEEKNRHQAMVQYMQYMTSAVSKTVNQVVKIQSIATTANEAVTDQLKGLQDQLNKYASQVKSLEEKIS